MTNEDETGFVSALQGVSVGIGTQRLLAETPLEPLMPIRPATATGLMLRSIMFELQDLGVYGIRDIDGPLIRADHQVMGFADQV